MAKRNIDGYVKSFDNGKSRLENMRTFTYDIDEFKRFYIRLELSDGRGISSVKYRFELEDTSQYRMYRTLGPEWDLVRHESGVEFDNQPVKSHSFKYLFSKVKLSIQTLKFIISSEGKEGGCCENIITRRGDPDGVFIGYVKQPRPDTSAVYLPIYFPSESFKKLCEIICEVLEELELLKPYMHGLANPDSDLLEIKSEKLLERIVWALHCDVYTHRLSYRSNTPDVSKVEELDATIKRITTPTILWVMYASGCTAEEEAIQEILNRPKRFLKNVTEDYVSPLCTWCIIGHINLETYKTFFLQ